MSTFHPNPIDMTTKNIRLQVLVSENLDIRMRKAAYRSQISRGAWVRQAIEERLERERSGLPAGVMLNRGVASITTFDRGFDRIEGIRRLDLK